MIMMRRVTLAGVLVCLLAVLVLLPATASAETTVTWWGWLPVKLDSADDQVAPIEQAFEAEHPDIDLQFRYIAQPITNYYNALRAALLAGEGPDVIDLQIGTLGEYRSQLEPLEPWAERYWGSDWDEAFIQLGLDEIRLAGGDTLYALPVGYSAQTFIHYNQALLEEAGVAPPTTKAELMNAIARLRSTHPGIEPLVFGAKDGWIDQDLFVVLANQVAPGLIYEAEAGRVSWTDPRLVRAMEIWKSLFTKGIFQEGALGFTSYPEGLDAFYGNEAAMWVIGSWHLNSLRTQHGYGLSVFPDMVGNGESRVVVASVDLALGINRASQNKEAAWEVVEFMTRGRGQEIFAGQFMQVTPALKDLPMESASLDAIGLESAEVVGEAVSGAIGRRSLIYPALASALERALQDVASGIASPEDALAQVQRQSERTRR